MIIARAIINLPTTLLGLMDAPSVLKRVMSSVLENCSRSYRYPAIIIPRIVRQIPHKMIFSPKGDRTFLSTATIRKRKINNTKKMRTGPLLF